MPVALDVRPDASPLGVAVEDDPPPHPASTAAAVNPVSTRPAMRPASGSFTAPPRGAPDDALGDQSARTWMRRQAKLGITWDSCSLSCLPGRTEQTGSRDPHTATP